MGKWETDNVLEIPSRTVKLSEIWDSGVLLDYLLGYFNVVVFKVILGSFRSKVSDMHCTILSCSSWMAIWRAKQSENLGLGGTCMACRWLFCVSSCSRSVQLSQNGLVKNGWSYSKADCYLVLVGKSTTYMYYDRYFSGEDHSGAILCTFLKVNCKLKRLAIEQKGLKLLKFGT